MNRKTLFWIFVVMPFLLLWGCDPSDPGSPFANQPPETRIVVAPLQDSLVDHFVSPSETFHMQWFGHDPDGQVSGYYLQVDNNPEVWTASADSAMAFESSQIDPSDPIKTIPLNHTFKVWAVDNEGLRDPTPASRSFNATNFIPVVEKMVLDFRANAVVGQGIWLGVEWSDSNASGAWFRVLVDNQPVTEWDERSEFQFCNLTDPTILSSIDTSVIAPVSKDLLPAGDRKLSVQVSDFGSAVSIPDSISLTVSDTASPKVLGVSGLYGTDTFYPDGSIFYQKDRQTALTINASAAAYFGRIQGYRYRYFYKQLTDAVWSDSTEWSDWGGPEIAYNNLPLGIYHFELICRDYTGKVSEVATYDLTLVLADYTVKNLLIIDETRDGNGNPGLPNDFQADNVYRTILEVDTANWTNSTGWSVSELDLNTHAVGTDRYVSPKDVYDKRLIIWHGDDKADIQLGNFTRILSEYLTRGGRLIISGWDVGAAFSTIDSATFTSGFAYNYLRLAGGKRDISRNTVRGFTGMLGNPDLGYIDTLATDPVKMGNNWVAVDRCWLFYPTRRTTTLGTWLSNTASPEFDGSSCAVVNFHPANAWKTITLGFPLYHTNETQATQFLRKAIEEIDK